VSIAKEARDDFWNGKKVDKKTRHKPFVAASIGCYGAYLADGSEYTGNYKLTKEQLKVWHRKRLAVIAKAEPDVFACETIPCLVEAAALVEVL
jgi:homocysteine S-methyltransferase